MWDSADRTLNIPQIMPLHRNLLNCMFLLFPYQYGKIQTNDTVVLGHCIGQNGNEEFTDVPVPKANFSQFTNPSRKGKNSSRT